MARAVVLLGGGDDVRAAVTRLLHEGASVVLVDHPEVLAAVLAAVREGDDRARLAVIAGDPSAPESRAAAVELAVEHYAAEVPDVVVFSQGLDPTVK